MNFFFSSRRRHTFFFQAEDGIRDRSPSRGLGDVYKRQGMCRRRSGFCLVVPSLSMLEPLVGIFAWTDSLLSVSGIPLSFDVYISPVRKRLISRRNVGFKNVENKLSLLGFMCLHSEDKVVVVALSFKTGAGKTTKESNSELCNC